MIKFIIDAVLKNNEEDLKTINRDINRLKNIKIPFERIRSENLFTIAPSFRAEKSRTRRQRYKNGAEGRR